MQVSKTVINILARDKQTTLPDTPSHSELNCIHDHRQVLQYSKTHYIIDYLILHGIHVSL